MKRVGDRIREVARDRFGFEELRAGQEEAIAAVLDGHDTLAVMPTGSGKSAIYQIPALLLNGPTVVVSPLIALQRDQLQSLEAQDVAPAAVVNSHARAAERREALEGLEGGELEFLFLAPEQLHRQDTLDTLREGKPSLFVVDEAHCISEWGHDFRPDYLRLGSVVETLGHPRILALTATAAPEVRDEIVARLGMRDARVIVRGFDRPNIWLGAKAFSSAQAKRDALLEEVAESAGPGIVYCSSRRTAEEVARELAARGECAMFYHGGMKAGDRTAVQEAFMSGETRIIVATTAFGMGIDKPDVRFVFHYDISDSLDSYYQEIGRAGRDGDAARALLFYRPEDLGIHKFFQGGGKVDAAKLEEVARTVEQEGEPLAPEQLRERTGLSKLKTAKAINRLTEAGALERLSGGEVTAATGVDLKTAAKEAAAEEEHRRDWQRLRIEKMRAYAELVNCRREYLLEYFGEEWYGPCGRCDNCEAGRGAAAPGPTAQARAFAEKSRVTHKQWGKGVVDSLEGDKITVLFDEAGRKTLSIKAVKQQGLLESV